MDDFHLPPRYRADTQIFYANCAVDQKGWQSWCKPKGVSMVMMLTIGGGGGGGGGFSKAAASSGSGGGGGACSGISRFIVPALLIPDILSVQVGSGGQGGAAGASGGAGINSYICTSRTAAASVVLPNILCYSNVNAPGGGSGGNSGSSIGGSVPTVAVIQPWNVLGWWLTTVGLVGGNGGAATGGAGGAITAWAAFPLTPGCGGGAGVSPSDFAGGAITATATLEMGSQGFYTGAFLAGGVTLGGNGNAGVKRVDPMMCTGGTGGGSNFAATAGDGAAAGYGCGGGGGGSGVTGGRGGNGGDGLVIITSW